MSKDAQAQTTVDDDGDFVRHAVIIPREGVSFSLIDDSTGERLALINAFVYDNGDRIIVDVIDKDDRFDKRTAFIFNDGQREFYETTGNLVSADFTRDV